MPVRPLAEFVMAAAAHDLSVLKIDVEGGEEAVILPVLDAGGWLPDVLLMETRHGAEWGTDLVARVHGAGFETVLEADGNTLFQRKDFQGQTRA